MHTYQAQPQLVAFIRKTKRQAYEISRCELRHAFAELIAISGEPSIRRYYGGIYRDYKAAMVIAMARDLATRC